MQSKTIKIIFWISTVLFAGFMIWSGAQTIVPNEMSIQFLHDYLGYPLYFIPFISVAKVLGGIALLIPGRYRIKEWAYAGLFFDLFGAIYSIVSVSQTADSGLIFLVLPVVVGLVSYFCWRRIWK